MHKDSTNPEFAGPDGSADEPGHAAADAPLASLAVDSSRGDLDDADAAELAQLVFEQAADALYVLDLESRRFLAVNPNYCRLVGYTREELLYGELTVDDLVISDADDHDPHSAYQKRAAAMNLKSDEVEEAQTDRLYHVAVRTREGAVKYCEVTIQRGEFRGRPVTFGSGRDITPVVRKQEQLENETKRQRDEIKAERHKTHLTFQANVRIMQITERIIRTPRFTKQLEVLESVPALWDEAVKFLASPMGMEFATAQIYTFDPPRENLELRAFASELANASPIDCNPELLWQVATGELKWAENEDKGRVAVPIKHANGIEGVLVIGYHRHTQSLIASEASTKKTLLEVIVTLGDLIGMRTNNVRLVEHIRRQTVVDQLTEVFNRRYFDAKLAEELLRTTRYNRELTLMVMDIDHFKSINDTLGHQQGDRLLQEFGDILKANTRSVDIVCRMGGDEFAVIFPETGLDNARKKAESLRQKVADHRFSNVIPQGGENLAVSISVGLAAAHDGQRMSAEELYHQADLALYDSKRAGRNRVSIRDGQSSAATDTHDDTNI